MSLVLRYVPHNLIEANFLLLVLFEMILLHFDLRLGQQSKTETLTTQNK